MSVKVDLYLGGDLGFWTLQQVPLDSIKQVFTSDDDIAKAARSLGTKVWMANADLIDFVPSEVGFSVHYPRILTQDIISKYRKIYNLHPGFLPWGRGYYPIFWALWEQTPAGATLHEMTARVDAGPIVAQLQVEYYPHDTGGSLFQRVRKAEKELFLEHWPKIIGRKHIPSFPQPGGGTYHSKKEFFELKERADWESMSGRDLVRLIRCLTFVSYTGLKIVLGRQKFEVHLKPLTSI